MADNPNPTQNQNPPPLPAAATVQQLRAAFPKASNEFILAQLERSATMEQAKDAYSAHLQAELDRATAKNAELEQAAKSKSDAAGAVKHVGTRPSGKEASADTGGDALAEFEDAVAAEMTRNPRLTRAQAHERVCKQNPELRKAMVAAHNAQHRRSA